MAVVNKSSSDSGVGFDSNAPLNAGAIISSDAGYGTEGWQLTKGTTWPYDAPYRALIPPSHTSVVVADFDPFDLER